MRLISGCQRSTPVSWLLVLSNVTFTSPQSRSNKMLQILDAHPNWPVYADVFEHPPRLASRHPIWSDMTPVNTTVQWREDWQSAPVVNYTTVTGPTNRQPGFNLPRQPWSLLNRSDRSRPMLCISSQMAPCQITDMWLWSATDYEAYRGRVSIDKARQRTTTTSCSWRWIRIQNHKCNEVENAFPIFKVSHRVRVHTDSHHIGH